MMTDKIILGKNAVYSSDCNETGINNNVIVCGGAGSGKTMSISEPRLLETYNSSLVATVTKRRIVNKYVPVFEKRGYSVLDLNFAEPYKSNVSYDPLHYLNRYMDITFIARSIVKANPQKQNSNADPYWDEAAISLLSAEIAYILMTKDEPGLNDVLDLHYSMVIDTKGEIIKTSLDKKFDYVEKKVPGCFAVNCWRSFRNLPPRTAGCVYSMLNTALDTLFTEEIREMFSINDHLDITQLGSTKTILFLTTSPVNPSAHFLVNIFYSQIFKSLFEYAESQPDGKLPIPVHVLCDDFATGSKIQNFDEYISVFREKQISVTLLIQSESQLSSIYGTDEATTIINNCDTYVYMGSMDLKTGHSISERINRPLEDILYMPVGKELIFRRGQMPIITERYDINQHEQFSETDDFSILEDPYLPF